MRRLLSLAVCLSLLTTVHAAEYYVSPRGNDAASGSAASAALASIGKGVSLLKAGDTLTILPGEYFETVTTDICGTAEAPVTIRARRPGTVLMRGDVDVSGFRPVPGVRHVYVLPFARRVECVSERVTMNTLQPQLSLPEVEMTLGSYRYDEQAGMLYVHSSDSRSPDVHRTVVSVTNGCGLTFVRKDAVAHVIVDGLSFTGFHHRDYDVQHGSRTRWGLFVLRPENVVVRRCTAYLNSGGIHFLGGGAGSIVEDCHAFANRSRFVTIANNILGWGIAGTTFRRNRVEGFTTGSTSQNDIAFYSGGDDCVMTDNLAVNAGLMIKGELKNAVQRGNVVVGLKFYRDHNATNLEVPSLRAKGLAETYVDPLNGDFRLQTGAKAEWVPRPDNGDVFYVSPEGNDTAPGTSIDKPWRTLAHAAAQAQPGHTIYLLPGIYAESLGPTKSGTAEKAIRYLRHGHGLVVLEGNKTLETGVDLSGREHIELRGLVLRGFARHGIFAKQAKALEVEQCIIADAGGDGAAFEDVDGLSFQHNLTQNCGGAGLRLSRCPEAVVTGNLFGAGRLSGKEQGSHLFCDVATLAGLWSDRNAFEPLDRSSALCAVDGENFATLADWQARSRLDAHSIATPPKLDFSDESGAVALAPDSPLPGAGPHAGPIGPFRRLNDSEPMAIEDIAVRGVTHTTANLEWWLPGTNAETTLEWGATPACENKIELLPAAYHSASLAGLQPGTAYYFRLRTLRSGERLRFTTGATPDAQPLRPEPTAVQTFTTAASAPEPRTLHVAVDGDDTRDGLSRGTAWRTISFSAAQARAGDTVLVHGGEYEEFVVVRATGDLGAPLTFRAAPGEQVWLTGSARNRATAFFVAGKNYVVIDGFHFRDFGALGSVHVVRFEGGAGHVMRRCFYDGRALSGYVNRFFGANGVTDMLIENCVIIGGMGEAIAMGRCPVATIRNNVIYVPSVRALTFSGWDRAARLSLTHNIIFDTIPSKNNNPLIRLMDVENLVSAYNVWFTRTGPEQRYLFEPSRIGDKDVWVEKPGGRIGRKLMQADLVTLTGQDATSTFTNPGLPVLATLYKPGKADLVQRDWLKAEMHLREGGRFAPLSFGAFLPPQPLHAADGKPIGLDPAAFPVQSPKP